MIILAVAPIRPVWLGHNLDPLIVSDRFNINACLTRHRSDCIASLFCDLGLQKFLLYL